LERRFDPAQHGVDQGLGIVFESTREVHFSVPFGSATNGGAILKVGAQSDVRKARERDRDMLKIWRHCHRFGPGRCS
jgi:hypothetical protein